MMADTTQNRSGRWVPSIPVPLTTIWQHCYCGSKFWTMGGYRGHYALVHILELS